jgi:arylsulfatase A
MRKKRHCHTMEFVIIALLLVACANRTAAATAGPNFILILSDDQGWPQTSVRMHPDRPDSKRDYYETPQLERLARRGMVFTSGYAPAQQCTPTRCSIQTGSTPARLRKTVIGPVCDGPDMTAMLTIPKALKGIDADYVTAHLGKWHIPKVTPEALGYDTSDGTVGNEAGNERLAGDPKRIFSLSRSAVAFIEKQVRSDKPFFLQISHYACHGAHEALAETIRKYESRITEKHHGTSVFAAMLENMDTGIGMVLDTVDRLGIGDRTYIIFLSDNGATGGGNVPLKGKKGFLDEGGIRVPFMVAGPGIAAGSYCTVPVVGYDLLPTLALLAGGSGHLPAHVDGGSLHTLLKHRGKGSVQRPTQGLVFHYPHFIKKKRPHSVIRDGNYKLVRFWDTAEVALYDLERDLLEMNDLAGAMPDTVTELKARLDAYLVDVNAETVEREGREYFKRKMKTEVSTP